MSFIALEVNIITVYQIYKSKHYYKVFFNEGWKSQFYIFACFPSIPHADIV